MPGPNAPPHFYRKMPGPNAPSQRMYMIQSSSNIQSTSTTIAFALGNGFGWGLGHRVPRRWHCVGLVGPLVVDTLRCGATRAGTCTHTVHTRASAHRFRARCSTTSISITQPAHIITQRHSVGLSNRNLLPYICAVPRCRGQ